MPLARLPPVVRDVVRGVVPLLGGEISQGASLGEISQGASLLPRGVGKAKNPLQSRRQVVGGRSTTMTFWTYLSL